MKSSKLLQVLAASSVAAVAAFSSSVYGAAQPFTASDGSASAIFTPGAGTLSISLTNNITTTTNVVDLLSDISFSVSGATESITSHKTVTPGTPNGTLSCVKGNATCVAAGAANNWYYANNQAGFDGAPVGTGTYLLTALVGPNKSLIIGDHSFSCNNTPPPGGKCPDGLGQTGFQPYINGTATFLLAIAGVTTDSIVSAVNFSFGTEPERVVGVPLPAAVWLFASGLLGLIGIARRRIGVSSTLAAART